MSHIGRHTQSKIEQSTQTDAFIAASDLNYESDGFGSESSRILGSEPESGFETRSGAHTLIKLAFAMAPLKTEISTTPMIVT